MFYCISLPRMIFIRHAFRANFYSSCKKGALNFHWVRLNAQASTFGSREILKKHANMQPGEGSVDLLYTSPSKSPCYFEVYSVDISNTANDCQFYIDWSAMLAEGKYRVKYSTCKAIKQAPTFNQLLVNKPPWARYDVTGFSPASQILTDCEMRPV